ncbi:MAG: hypothetical protein J6Y94_04750 [Bacteriovoracaceae bacterium]|nr:hypothetical protein [Bacteriovoracaceae bacterium]
MKQYMWAVLVALSLLAASNTWAGRSPSVELDEDISSNCSSMIGTDVYNFCLRAATINAFNAEGNVDCIECLLYADEKTTETNPWVEALGVLAGPMASFGSNWVWAESYKKSNQHYAEAIRKSNLAWADSYRDTNEYWSNAYMAGYRACENNFNAYLAYTKEMLADPVTAEQAEVLAQCNGQDLDLYTGYQGMYSAMGGMGMNPYMAAGYSPAFMSGMLGPYGLGMNPYGLNSNLYGGIGLPGIDGGVVINNPLAPLANLLNNGIQLEAGISLNAGGNGLYNYLGDSSLITIGGGVNPAVVNTGVYAGGGLGTQIVDLDASGNPIYNTGGINNNYNLLSGVTNPNLTVNYALPGTTVATTATRLAGYPLYGGGVGANTAVNERAIVSQQDAQAGAVVLQNQAQLYNQAALRNLNLTNVQCLTSVVGC